MKSALLPILAWAGALQSVAPGSSTVDSAARMLGTAGMLGTLTVLVYRLGVWRQEMEHAKTNVGVQIEAHRQETAASFDRIERRLEAMDRVLSAAAGHRVAGDQWRAHTERRLEQLEQDTGPYAPAM